jgi:hypothetical protein
MVTFMSHMSPSLALDESTLIVPDMKFHSHNDSKISCLC